jgi:hypothetical protein
MTNRNNALGPFKVFVLPGGFGMDGVPETDWHQLSLNRRCFSLLGDSSANITDVVASLQQHTTFNILAK